MSTPNSKLITKLLKKHKAFINKQKQFIEGKSDDEGEDDAEDGVYLRYRKQYNSKIMPDVEMKAEQ